MHMDKLTFDQLPTAISELYHKVEAIEALLQQQNTLATPQEDQLLTVPQAAHLAERGKIKQDQTLTVLNYLKLHTATASMVSVATGIPQKNICWYKRALEKEDLLWEVYRATCKITSRQAWFLTTNTHKKPTQLKLF